MAVFRIVKNKDYTIMSNHHLRNTSLSLKAKGLQSLFLSLPPDWDFTLAGLAYICQDGISSVRSGVAELEKHGYLTRCRIREANGQLSDIEYTIHEIPQKPDGPDADNSEPPVDNPPCTGKKSDGEAGFAVGKTTEPVCEKPTSHKPTCGNPTQGFPTYGKRTELKDSSNQGTQKSNTDSLKIHQSIGADAPDAMDAMDIYREILRENIEYDHLCQQYKYSRDELTEILELMLETVCSTKKTIRVGGEDKPAEVVKSRMMKLNQQHIEYVLETLGKNTTEVRNIKSYLLTTLFNAPSTIDNYYKQMVQHDMYGDM